METTTPFDLNHAIQAWRQRLAQTPAIRAENLDELETHLRDSVATLQGRGLSAEEAFLVATRRAGTATQLGAEYDKINQGSVWLNRLLWMLVGVQIFKLLTTLISSTSTAFVVFTIKPFLALGFGAHTQLWATLYSGACELAMFVMALIVCRRLILKRGDDVTAWLGKALKNPTRLTMILLATIIMTFVFPMITRLTFQRFVEWQNATGNQMVDLFIGVTSGGAYAYMVELLAMAIITLLLARRQMFVKIGR